MSKIKKPPKRTYNDTTIAPTGPGLYDDPEAGLRAAIALYYQQRDAKRATVRSSHPPPTWLYDQETD